jgi:hypothetical protein
MAACCISSICLLLLPGCMLLDSHVVMSHLYINVLLA